MAYEAHRDPFHAWLDQTLSRPVPREVAAFALNLYEGVSSFDAQIVGTPVFDVDDRRWTCDDIFSSGDDLYSVGRGIVDDSWHEALRLYIELFTDYLAAGRNSGVLSTARGVGVGFIDGDLILLRPSTPAEPVHAVFDYFDGVQEGVADFHGRPHAFRREFDEDADDWTNFYRVKPLNEPEFSIVMTAWAIWTRWLAAYRAGAVALDTHPVLPADARTHAEIEAAVTAALSTDTESSKVVWATFRGRMPPDGKLDVAWLLVSG